MTCIGVDIFEDIDNQINIIRRFTSVYYYINDHKC